MGLPEKDIGTKNDLAGYRIETARSNLKSAEILFDAGEYKGANNRACYAIFHAINAVHALAGEAFKRHKDAIGNFNKKYVKTENFPKDIGRKIGEAEEIRHASDYVIEELRLVTERKFPAKRKFLDRFL